MAQKIDQVYEDAIASGLLPGVSVAAGDKNGNIIYQKSFGKASQKEGRDHLDFTPSTICSIASMSKLMTSVAVLQCAEDDKLDLDQDVRPLLPEMGKYGIITGFDDENNSAVLTPNSTPITPRMLLCHTSGHEYDRMNPLLWKWRASRNEEPWTGPTVEYKSSLPLVFTPETGFAYGGGYDWAGKLIEVVTGVTLEDFMRTRIWEPLGIENDASFYPKTHPHMRDRMADISTLDEKGAPPAVPTDFDPLGAATECLGGVGVFASAEAFFKFLSALFRRDTKLLTPESYTELFRPQLDERCEKAFNEYLALSPAHTQYLALGIPLSIPKTWSLAGMIMKGPQEGRFEKGNMTWAGLPSLVWFMDHEAGVYGTAFCQMIPPQHPSIIALHEDFQRGVLEIVKRP